MSDEPKDHEDSHTRMRGVIGLNLTNHSIVGVVLVALGALWTLDNLQVVDSGRVLQFWPLILLGFGVAKLNGYHTRRDKPAGTALTVIGGLLLLRPLGLLHNSVFSLWPLLLIAGGFSLLRRSRMSVAEGTSPPNSPWFAQFETQEPRPDGHISVLALLGAVPRRVHADAFRGAEATAIMGGIELDLREAEPAGERVYVDVFTWWGGIEVIVPRNWKVVVEASPILGGVVDTTLRAEEPIVTTLVVRGVAIMGGVEVKNKPTVRVSSDSSR